MGLLQVWLVVGIPVLVVGLVLFASGSPVRKLIGYLVLAAGFAVIAMVDRVSAALFGGILALLYAAGQGVTGRRDDNETRSAAPAP